MKTFKILLHDVYFEVPDLLDAVARVQLFYTTNTRWVRLDLLCTTRAILTIMSGDVELESLTLEEVGK